MNSGAAAAGKGKILVVDDDRLVLATVTHGLTRAGFEVVDADNGDDAILLAREHRPDLALLDIRMQGKTGFDVAEYLRGSLGTPFMFLSAFADAATIAHVKSLGAVAYLVKPLDIAQIIPTVEAALASSRSRAPQGWPPVPETAPAEAAAKPLAQVPVSASVAAAASALVDPLPLAVGMLMQRYALPRAEALRRLSLLADSEGRSVVAQADALLAALEFPTQPSVK
jgi:response regulator NasT